MSRVSRTPRVTPYPALSRKRRGGKKLADLGRAYRGLSSEARRAERRQKLIQAAVEVFGTVGFHAATVRQICAAAGLTERYFYESFDNQHSLFDAAYDHELDRLRATIVAAIAGAPRGFPQMIEAVMRAYYGILQREPRLARILLIEIYGAIQDMDRLYQRGVRDFAALMRGVIEANTRLSLGGVDAQLFTTALIGAVTHLATHWLLNGYRESLDTMVSNSLALILAVSDRLAQPAHRT